MRVAAINTVPYRNTALGVSAPRIFAKTLSLPRVRKIASKAAFCMAPSGRKLMIHMSSAPRKASDQEMSSRRLPRAEKAEKADISCMRAEIPANAAQNSARDPIIRKATDCDMNAEEEKMENSAKTNKKSVAVWSAPYISPRRVK